MKLTQKEIRNRSILPMEVVDRDGVLVHVLLCDSLGKQEEIFPVELTLTRIDKDRRERRALYGKIEPNISEGKMPEDYIALLQKALQMRRCYKQCQICGAILSGCEHAETCELYQVEKDAFERWEGMSKAADCAVWEDM